MKRKVILLLAIALSLPASLLMLYIAEPTLVLPAVVTLRSHFTHIEPNREVEWAQGPSERAASPEERRPNIVVILADDLGYNDLTFGGGGVADGAVPTPNIDRIARDGAMLSAGYAGAATCAPSRAAIMTGRFATRFGFEFTPIPLVLNRALSRESFDGLRPVYHAEREDELPPVEDMGLPFAEITLAEHLGSHGYRTLMLGKWHLGERDDMRPHRRGFDEALAFMSGGSLYLPKDADDAVNARISTDPADGILWAALPYGISFNESPLFKPRGYMTDYLAEEAVRAIEANRNRPFFMYLAFNAPHTPLQALKSDYDALPGIADHRLRVYAAMVRALDRGVGTVMEALRKNGLEENTIVIFTSDNGGAGWVGLPDLNRPWRGWKATFFEGGVHVPYFVQWPARIPAGGVFTGPAAHVDIFATAAAAAGAAPPADRVIDGIDLVPSLADAVPAADRPLYWRSGHYKALLKGGWKLQLSERPQGTWLFDLVSDPLERNNLARSEPAKLAEMHAALEEIDGEQAAPAWPAIIEGPVAIDHPMGRAISDDDEFVYWPN